MALDLNQQSIMDAVLPTISGKRVRGVVGANGGTSQKLQIAAPYLLQVPYKSPISAGEVVTYANQTFLLGKTFFEANTKQMRMFIASGPFTWKRLVTTKDPVSGLTTGTAWTTLSTAAYIGLWRLGAITDVFSASSSKWSLIGPPDIMVGDTFGIYTVSYVDYHEGLTFAEAK